MDDLIDPVEEYEMRPGGPLCGCDYCEEIRRETGVEELTVEQSRLAEQRQWDDPERFRWIGL